MTLSIVNINSPVDISWSSYLQANDFNNYSTSNYSSNSYYLSTQTAFSNQTFGDLLDFANADTALLGDFYGEGKSFDNLILYSNSTLVNVNLSDPAHENDLVLVYNQDTPLSADDIANFLVFLLNGFGHFLTACPCFNLGIPGSCNDGGWNLATRNIPLDFGGGSTYLAPCMNPGNSIQVSSGIAPFFNVNAQVMRIRNLDRIQFLKVGTAYKSCTKTMVITINGVTCGKDDKDHDTNTKFGIDVSMQASVMGSNLFPENNEKYCNNLVPSQFNTECPANLGCVQVFIPATFVEMSMEIPFQAGFNSCVLPGISQRLKLDGTSLKMNFNFTNTPEFKIPSLNADFLLQIEAAMLQLTNTGMKSILNNIISEKLTTFVTDFLKPLAIIEIFSTCVTYPVVNKMICNTNTPILPIHCDLCDECCLCLTQGDCGDVCRENCPCVVPFCKSMNRTLNPLWWTLFIIVSLLLVMTSFVLIRMVISIG